MDVSAFLVGAGPLSAAELGAVLRVDQRLRWRRGERRPAEAYLDQFPEARAAPDQAVDLIFNEFLLREQLNERPDPEEYLCRFPAHASVLKAQIELHQAFNSVASAAGLEGYVVRLSAPTEPAADTGRKAGADPAPWPLPRDFGRYRVEALLGRGGMATVYLAEDRELSRPVALKVPHFGATAEAALVERFAREAGIAATFNHPHLCPVYDVGQSEGVHYLTMPVIRGEPLSARLQREGRLPQRLAAQLAFLIARAVHVAHAAGVIHRDLKPSNVMLTEDGAPIVMDFGLARHVTTRDVRLTASGVLVGTPAYMAPEQIGAEASSLNPACDVYSLGVMLYEMLTGRLPFRGAIHEVLKQVLVQEPEPPSRLQADLDPRLEAICLKAMSKNPRDRFASVDALAGALDAYLLAPDGVPGRTEQLPRPAPTRTGLHSLLRRRAVLATVVLFAVCLAGGLGWYFLSAARSAREPPAPDAAFQTGTTWKGTFAFRPPLTYTSDVQLRVESRMGDRFRGVYSTEMGKYVWRVEGTVRDGAVSWEFTEVIREDYPTEVVGNAFVEGRCDGKHLDVVFEHRLKKSVADMWLRVEE